MIRRLVLALALIFAAAPAFAFDPAEALKDPVLETRARSIRITSYNVCYTKLLRAFPSRDLAIFIAMGVIVLSLVSATALLPRLLAGCEMPAENADTEAEDAAMLAASKSALAAVERLQHVLARDNPEADRIFKVAAQVMETYQHRIARRDGGEDGDARWADGIEREMLV